MKLVHQRRFVRAWGLCVALAAVLGVAQGAQAQGAPGAGASAQTPGRAVVLQGGRVHVGDGSVIEGGVVVIGADGKLLAVGKDAPAPSGALVVDVRGKEVTPGFVDPATSLGATEVDLVSTTTDQDAGGDRVRSAFRIVDAFNPFNNVIPIQRAGGVTSVVCSPTGGLVAGQGAWLDLGDGPKGEFAQVQRAPLAMVMDLGQWSAEGSGGSRGGLALEVRELFDDVKFYKDNRAKFDGNQARRLSASRLDLEALIPVLEGKLPVVVRVHRASDIRAALGLAKELGLKIIVEGGEEAWMVRDELAQAKVPVTLYAMANLPDSFETLGSREDNAALLREAGVEVLLSVFDTHNARNVRQMAGNAVRGGMKPADALRAVTLGPATAFGMGATHGSLESGKWGNVVVWSGDPFELSTRVERIYVGGREVSLENRQRQLFERYRALPRRAAPAPFDPVDVSRP